MPPLSSPSSSARRPENVGRPGPHPNAYAFHVDEFALGNLDGRGKRFYTTVQYPTDQPDSYLSYDERKEIFRFQICPLAAHEPSAIPRSRTPAFPWDRAPPAAQPLDGEFKIPDIIGRGISFVQEDGQVMVTRATAAQPLRAVEHGSRTGRYGTTSGSNAMPLGDQRGMGRTNAQNGPGSYGGSPGSRSTAKSHWSSNLTPESKIQELRTVPLKKCILTITLRRPPRFFVGLARPDGQTTGTESPAKDSKSRYRQATSRDFCAGHEGRSSTGVGGGEAGSGSIEVGAEQEVFKISTSLTYRFTMCLESREIVAINRFLDRFRLVYIADPTASLANTTNTTGTPSQWGYRSAGGELIDPRPERDKRIKTLDVHPVIDRSQDKAFRALPFTLRWLIEGLVSHNIVLEHERPTLVRVLESAIPVSASGTNREHQEKVTKWRERVLTVMFNEERIAEQDLESFIKRRARTHRRPSSDEPAHVMKVYRAHVTPTKVIIFPPEAELTNSVLRHFGREKTSNRFLRLAFTDEDDRLRVDPAARNAHDADESTGILGRVRRALDEGLSLAGRKYRFLASSASQLKEASAWFLNDGVDLNVHMIRQWAGSVEEKVVAKYAARLGQPFSSTTYVNIRGEQLPLLPDIKRNGYIFTDGCGVCSPDMAKEAGRAVGLKSTRNVRPSAMQIRLGGCKGVLAVDPRLTGYQYALRESMRKFESDLVDLNVVRVAQYHQGYLNRQYIIILSHLGIPDEFFIRRFTEERDKITGLPKRFASGTQTKADRKLVRTMAVFPAEAIADAGFHGDVCLQEVLQIIETRMLWDLKWKARLPIEKGCFLLGVCDETGLLEEGEVFVQVDDPEEEGKAAFIVLGDVVVCRPPVLHPGDVRRVRAVDHPELHHHKNVVVFNTKGERDLPNFCSGGDLDGDDYTCIYDPELLFDENEPPMDFTGPTPKAVSRICEADLKDNLVGYLKNDQLGAIGSAHLAWADLQGPGSSECLELAIKHSLAVDFGKTGIPADLPEDLRPRKYPMFMGKPKVMSYESYRILGKVFRLLGPDKSFPPSKAPQIAAGPDPRLSSIVVPPSVLKVAGSLKRRYDHELWTLLLRYRLTEAEAMAGLVLDNARRKRGKDADLKDPVREAFGLIVTTAVETGIEHVQELGLPEASEADGRLSAIQLLAVACYQVAYDDRHEAFINEEDPEMDAEEGDVLGSIPTKLISFAWVLFQEIVTMPGIAPQRQATSMAGTQTKIKVIPDVLRTILAADTTETAATANAS